MPHHHHRHIHARAPQDIWDKFTSKAANVFNDAFPTANSGKKAKDGDNGPETIYRTVFTTMTPEGWTGTQLSTLPPKIESPSPTTVAAKTTPTTVVLDTSSPTPKLPATSNTLPSELSSVTDVSIPPTLVVAATTEPTTKGFSNPTQTTTTGIAASATSSADVTATDGPSAGAKAGIAIGVLGGILVVFLALYWLFTRRKKQIEEDRRVDDEKHNGPFADSNAIPGTPATSARAPRLSLRPVTQFLPNIGNQSNPDRRASHGAAIPMTASPTQNTNRGLTAANVAQNPPSTSSSNHSANPFGNNAERMYSPIPEEHSRAVTPTSQMESEIGSAITTNSPPRATPATAASNATMAAGAAVGLSRKASLRGGQNAPKPLDLTRPVMNLSAVPPSPAGTDFSVNSMDPGHTPGPSNSAAAIAAAGGPAQSAVHRVQLDFKPTMDDELELRAGQLVRLLHEYDDGWALCIRLDRSQQGVVPRTCLSTRPVKPRPNPGAGRPGPPINPIRGPGYPPANRGPQGAPHNGPPYPRPGSAQSGRASPYGGPPMDNYGNRPHSPAHGRPMSPAHGQRSQSPGPRYQQQQPPRSQSPSGMQRRMSPPGQSPMNQEYGTSPPSSGSVSRKPVPGQTS
ncbi:variant SH3 domain-containing protein [Coniochaeta sp. 2T2.1]|nr:variant SH3 domain-containing protein [Coniochaeta sp. 2T2.1]